MLLMTSDGADSQEDIFFFTKAGMVKRTLLSEYSVRRSKVAAISLAKNDEVVKVCTIRPSDDLYCLTRSGMFIRFGEDEVSPTGRVTRGVKAMRVMPKDQVAYAGGIQDSDHLLLISERGYIKRVPCSMIDSQRRAGKGVHSFYFNKNGSNGTYIAASFVPIYRVPSAYKPLRVSLSRSIRRTSRCKSCQTAETLCNGGLGRCCQ